MISDASYKIDILNYTGMFKKWKIERRKIITIIYFFITQKEEG